MKCENCGHEFIGDSCPFCGIPKKDEAAEKAAEDAFEIEDDGTAYAEFGGPERSKKNRKTALFLCVFLGWTGAHQFYVGRIGLGICYLCTLGLCCFGWITDIVKIAVGTFPDKHGALLRDED